MVKKFQNPIKFTVKLPKIVAIPAYLFQRPKWGGFLLFTFPGPGYDFCSSSSPHFHKMFSLSESTIYLITHLKQIGKEKDNVYRERIFMKKSFLEKREQRTLKEPRQIDGHTYSTTKILIFT